MVSSHQMDKWINYSGAVVAAGKLLCIHRTSNHSFLYCFKLLNNIISNTSHDDQQAHWTFTGISKRVDFSRQRRHSHDVGAWHPCGSQQSCEGTQHASHQPVHSLPSLLASWATSHLSRQDKSHQSAQNYPFSTQHDIIMPVILYGCISSDRW